MDVFEKQIKDFVIRQRAAKGMSRQLPEGGPSTEEFYRYLVDELKGEPFKKMVDHLRRHPDDVEVVLKARALWVNLSEAQGECAPEKAIRAAQGIFKEPKKTAVCPKWLHRLYAAGMVAAFLGSFLLPRYFLQFLALAVLLGIKWIVDERAARTQILIYKALQEEKRQDFPRSLSRAESRDSK
ncbi:MAG: hypothetical protein HY592_05730 [Candidatus Omnitrophica bacterium]|nr:hypothetical protein [Candidatus Omnitrophota bacterium]